MNSEQPKPRIGILDRRFVYVPAAATDIRKTFERFQVPVVQPANVKPIKKAKAA